MSKPTILIIDDDFVSMMPLRDLLSVEHDYQVELTAEARLPSRLAATSFDLICLDLMIHRETPVVTDRGEQITVDNIAFDGIDWKDTGLEFLTRLRNGEFSQAGQGTQPDVPVIVLTAIADQNTIDRVTAHCQNSPTWFIEKPFPPRVVIRQIRVALKEA